MFTNFFCKFTDHPKSVCMSYIQHFSFSFGLSFYFLKKSVQALIHSVFPNFYITSSSDVTKELNDKFKNVGCKSDLNDESNDESNDELNDDWSINL